MVDRVVVKRKSRIKGHALAIQGERGCWSGYCRCGWSESGSSHEVVRDEYTRHQIRIQGIEYDPDRGEYYMTEQGPQEPRVSFDQDYINDVFATKREEDAKRRGGC